MGRSDREWLEPHYFDTNIRPIGNLRVIVPSGPDHPDALLDACIAFFSNPFRSCPSFANVEVALGSRDRIEFDNPDDVPHSWASLRDEARPRFSGLRLWKAELVQIQPTA